MGASRRPLAKVESREIRYYSEAVMRVIDSWPVGIRAVYARITERMQRFGPNLGMPLTRAMGGKLFEVRARGRQATGRAFFCTVTGRRIIVLHAFMKKSQKTPAKELRIARRRLEEVLDENP